MQNPAHNPGRIPIKRCALFLSLLVLSGLSPLVTAATISLSLSELGSALTSARGNTDAVQRLVLDRIQQQLTDAGLGFENGSVIYQTELVDEIVEDGCNNTRILQMNATVGVREDTSFGIELESLFEPLELTLELFADLEASGRARQTFGFRFGSCQQVARDSFDFTAIGPVGLMLSVTLDLDPVWIDEMTLRIRPAIELRGELLQSGISVDVDDSVLRSLLEDFLQEEVDSLFGPARIQQEIAGLQARVDAQLQEALSSDEGGAEGFLDITLPPADDAQIVALYELLSPRAGFLLTGQFIESRRLELIAALVLNDTEALDQILEDAAVCQLSAALQIDLPQREWFILDSGACEPVDGSLPNGTLYSDSQCTLAFDFFNTDYDEFCEVALDSDRLGSPLSRSTELDRWTYSPGTQFDIGALSFSGKTQPLMQRTQYKTVNTAGGECQLEMRVYTSDPNAQDRVPLLAFHGGSWQHRGTGFLGIENMATHFVDAGFVVFSAFYRLIGDDEGGIACNSATLDQLRQDAEDALDWVVRNQQSYGATGKPVVFGQSSGGHLATALAVSRPQDVERVASFYAPADFRDFGEQILSGEYAGEQGRAILEAVTGSTIDELDLDSALVNNNSFPATIAQNPSIYPPVFMLHGESDTLLPFRQSVRLCNGLAGDVEGGPAEPVINTESLKRVVSCDQKGSQLHLIAEGEHILDLCLTDELCLSGSPASASVTADSIQTMLDWSAAEDPANTTALAVVSGGGSLGAGFLLLVFARVPGGRKRQGNRRGELSRSSCG